MTKIVKKENVVKWQNHSLHYYRAARLLFFKRYMPISDFCAQHSLELILKAILIYYVPSFNPKEYNHKMKELESLLHKEVSKSRSISIPEYFYYDSQYQMGARYPLLEKELTITKIPYKFDHAIRDDYSNILFQPDDMLNDLDDTFWAIYFLVPFNAETLLKKWLTDEKYKSELYVFRRKNKQMANIRNYIEGNNIKP